MKINFALDFRHDAVTLLAREQGGWRVLGATSFGAETMDKDLADLLAAAERLAPGGFATKLILPNDQILYTELATPGPTATSRLDQIERGLIGLTPYQPSELVFDHIIDGDTARVAVIARETLQEAEGFAANYGFNPAAFVAVAADGAFDGEVFFGPAPGFADKAQGAAIVRDADAVVVLPNTPAVDALDPAPEPMDLVAAADQSDNADATGGVKDPKTFDDAMAETPIDSDELAVADLPHWLGGPDPDAPAPDVAPSSVDDPENHPPRNPAWFSDDDEAPLALDVAQEDVAPEPAPAEPELLPEVTPKAKAAPAAAPLATTPALAASTPNLRVVNDVTLNKIVEPKAQKPVLGTVAEASKRVNTKPEMRAPAGKTGLKERLTVLSGNSAAKKPIKGTKPALTPGQAAKPAARPGSSSPNSVEDYKLRARGNVAPPGRPRYMLLTLTLVLLVILALIAGWSSYLASVDEAPAAVQTATTTAQPGDPTAVTQTQTVEAPPAVAAVADDVPADTASGTVASAPPAAPQPPAPETAPEVLAETATQTLTSPQAVTGDAILLSTSDQPPLLPQIQSPPDQVAIQDPPPAPQAAPPPFGTVYAFLENGLIQATPEGIVTPEGVLLFAGRPTITPPPRPFVETAVPADPAAEAGPTPLVQGVPIVPLSTGAAPVSPVADDVVPFADPLLQGKLPRSRPEALTVPSDLGAVDAGPTTALAGISRRPVSRPEALVVAQDIGNPSTVPQNDGSVGLAPGAASDAVVAISRIPPPRPRDIEGAVESAVQAALAFPVEAPEEPAPAPPPKENSRDENGVEVTIFSSEESDDAEPEVADAGIKSGASTKTVAKNATFRNAIDLGETNLIGVYGTENRRYALVRTGNGRFKKVRVGDSVDGGEVAAINTNELRLQKGGRLVVLEVPGG